jgi:hypothetical protein
MTAHHHGPGRHPDLTDQELRQGEIVLNSRRRRIVFLAGLAGFVLLGLLGGLIWM